MQDQRIQYTEASKKPKTSEEMRLLLLELCDILRECGFDPVRQISGYLLSGDPTFLPEYKNARVLITRIDPDRLLSEMIRNYLEGGTLQDVHMD